MSICVESPASDMIFLYSISINELGKFQRWFEICLEDPDSLKVHA